ncbi:hypothetical protein IQ265_27390 [Nodosilinea sp. LEGE 06152]|uniref:hypothetical protein n=1 Tax=Nodosilinea sp. LEGE 06152 TaxID=2777966 RepID=UPI00187F69C7|nr:hypothetical protein [Nodosilinea sp. LEGE 06152]MBE9160517.1 hypothetical protein [Nodosilinea sp. LEGE 06152]
MEHARALDVLLSYQRIASYAVFNELNVLIEFELKFTANRILDQKGASKKGYSRSKELTRARAVKTIEDEYGISLYSLPCAIDAEDIRDIVNAYKHDDCYGKTYELKLPWGDIQKRHELDIEEIKAYIKAVGKFLFSLPGERADLGENYVRIKKTHYVEQVIENRRWYF